MRPPAQRYAKLEPERIHVLGVDDDPAFAFQNGLGTLLELQRRIAFNAQVNGGYSLPPEEKIVYDMYYIRNQSLRMDLHCLVKTVRVVFTGNGAR